MATINLANPVHAAVALTAAYLVHLVEEWLLDFPTWSQVIRGAGVSGEEFIAINASFLAIIISLTLIARRRGGMAWFPGRTGCRICAQWRFACARNITLRRLFTWHSDRLADIAAIGRAYFAWTQAAADR